MVMHNEAEMEALERGLKGEAAAPEWIPVLKGTG
jgi:hypothetical protein